MSYDSSTGIISAPVSIDDVRSCLGESSYDLGTLCKSSKINMYSIHKPTRWTDLFRSVAQSGSTPLTNAQWWAGTDNDFNISVVSTTLGKLVAGGETPYGYFQDPKANQWSLKHVNGSTYPYRLLDFEGYTKSKDWSAVAPVTDAPIEFVYSTDTTTIILDSSWGGTFQYANSAGSADSGGLVGAFTILNGISASNLHLGFMCRISGLSSGGDAYKCKYFACTLPCGSSVTSGAEHSYSDSHGVLQGTVYKVSDYQTAIRINFPASVFSSYAGKTIALRPIASNTQIAWPYNGSYSTDSSAIIKMIMPPEKLCDFSALLNTKKITDLNYKSPTLTVTAATVALDSGRTYKMSNVTVQATRDSTDKYSLAINLRVTSVTLCMEIYANNSYNYYTSSYKAATGTYSSPIGSFTIGATASSASKAMSGFSATATAYTGVSGTLYGNVQVTAEIHATDSTTGKTYVDTLTANKRVKIS